MNRKCVTKVVSIKICRSVNQIALFAFYVPVFREDENVLPSPKVSIHLETGLPGWHTVDTSALQIFSIGISDTCIEYW